MLYLSEVLLQEHDLANFEDVIKALKKRAQAGEMLFQIDVRPPFSDTPKDWEIQLETAFTSPGR